MSAENNEYSFEFERNAMKKLSIMLNNGCQSECWTFYKMAIIETLDQADLWLCSHMNYYVTENHAGRFGDCGEQYGSVKTKAVPVYRPPSLAGSS